MKLFKDWTLAHLLYYLCKIGYWFIGIILIIICIGALIDDGLISPWTREIPVEVKLATLEELDEIQADNFSLTLSHNAVTRVKLHVSENESVWPAILFNIWEILLYIASIIVLLLFSRIFKSIIDKNPFHEKNPTYLFIIGWLLFLIPIISNLFFKLYSVIVFSDINFPSGINFDSIGLSVGNSWKAGLFIIVLGYVFKKGRQLYMEQKLTV